MYAFSGTTTYTYDDVGNRETMVRQTPTEQITTIYTYNEKDQLETETQTVLQADGGTYAATPTPKRSAGITLAAIASISFTGLLIPFLLLRTSTGGKRVRRNRRFIAAVSAFFIPLMAVDPTTVYALQNESLAYLALVTAGAATTDPDTTIIQYQYDNNGNTIEKTTTGQAGNSTTTYTYDSENHLIKLDKNLSPQSITTYTYDTEGIRTSQQTGTERTTYTTDKNRPYAQVLEERNESNQLTKRYTYGHDLISQTTNPNQAEESIKYFHYDGQMSTRTLTEGNPAQEMFRQITDTYTYDAFGNTTTKTGATDNQYKYTGEQYDANAGFYYLRARYYSPMVGRFMTRDTYTGQVNDPYTLHRYLYTKSNVIDRYDPSGAMSINILTAVAIGAVIINIGATVYNGVRKELSATAIGWQVLTNLAFFGAIAASILAGGILGLLIGIGVLAFGLVGLYRLIKSWPDMDTTDKVIAVIQIATFVMFGAAVAGGAFGPPRFGGPNLGDTSTTPACYFGRPVIDMARAEATGGTYYKWVAKKPSVFLGKGS